MKKLLISLLTLLTLSTLADSSHADVSAFKAYASNDNQANYTRYEGDFLDSSTHDTSGDHDVPEIDADLITEEEISSSESARLNNTMTNSTSSLYSKNRIEINEYYNFKKNLTSDDYLTSSDGKYTAICVDEANALYQVYYYHEINPYIYFSEDNTGDVSFYTRITFNSYFEDYIVKANLGTALEIPFLIINEVVYGSVYYGGLNNYYYKTYNGCTLDIHYGDKYSYDGGGLYLKIDIPNLENITSLIMLDSQYYSPENDNTYINGYINPYEIVEDERFFFRFHSSMHGKYYYYRFIFHSFDLLDGSFVIDYDKQYPLTTTTSGIWYDDVKVDATYIKLRINETTHEMVKDSESGKSVPKTTALEPRILRLDITSGTLSGSHKVFNFGDLDIEATSSGSVEILEIGWQRTLSDQTFESYVHDYSDVNLYRFSFDASKSIRVFTYEWAGYKRSYYTNNRSFWDYLFAGPAQYLLDDRYLYQCYGFDFYFDNCKTQEIPNVKQIALKWQCGYEVPNTAEGSNGWYPDSGNKAKNVKIAVKDVDANKKLLNYALDDDGMFVSSNTDEALMTDPDGVKHDYVVCKKFEKGNLDTYITQMSALDIYYQSDKMQVVKLTGNSAGYHPVYDDATNQWFIYDKDGNYVPDLGVYITSSGYPVPAEDVNGDGEFTADETIDDRGEGKQYFDDPLAEKSEIDKFLDWWESLTNSIKNFKWDRLFTIIILFVIVIIFGPSLIDWVKKVFSK